MREGGGTRRPLDKPNWTTSSQPPASASGTSRPSIGRAIRAKLPLRAAGCAVAGSMAASIDTTVIKPLAKARRISVRRYRDVLIVDEIVECLLHVDICRDNTGLLERDAGSKDRLPLWRADLVMRELGALLELLVDNVSGQLGHRDEVRLQF